MWYYVKWGFWLTVLAIFSLFLNYVLPDREVVRIVNTEVKRQEFGVNSIFWNRAEAVPGSTTINRDVQFISTIDKDGNPRVFRNEDTGWLWPPYFKFSSADLQAEAANLISDAENPKWVIVRHYGWRSRWLTAFPNAVDLTETATPDERLIPWLNILIIIGLAALIRAVQVRLWRFFGRLFGRDRTQTG